MLPEEKARVKIDKQLTDAGWDIVNRNEYVPNNSSAVREALMKGNKESDYLLFVDNKAIIHLSATDTNLAPGNYYYDVQVNTADGRVDTVLGPAKFKIAGGVKF